MPDPHSRVLQFALFAHLGCIAPYALAAPTDTAAGQAPEPAVSSDAPEVQPPEPTPDLVITLTAGGLHRFEADLDDGGDFASTHAGLGVSISKALGDAHRLSAGIEAIWSSYDLSLPAELSPDSDPFDEALQLRGSLGLGGRLADDWRYTIGGSLGFAGEPDADVGDALVWSGIASVSHVVSPNLVLGLGVGVASRIEDDPIIFPVPIVRWTFAERWTLETGAADRMLLSGPAASLTFEPHDEFAIVFSVSYANTTLRLDDDGSLPDGVFEVSGVPITGEIVWKPSRSFELKAYAGVIVAGEIETRDNDGDTIGDSDYDPQALVGVEATIRF